MTDPATSSPVHAVFGATGGIGSALARRLAASGARLVLASRRPEPLQALADELDALACPLDLTDPAAADACLARALEAHGRLDGAACCVGSILLKPAHLTTDADWAATLNANLTTAFHLVRAAARTLTGPGAVALVSSAAARVGLPNHEAIAAAKAGVEGLVRAAAASYAPRGLRVNAVAPGLVRTPLSARLTGSEAALKASIAMHPLGRIGEPDDVAAALAWLLGPESTWVTGQVIGVDGGLAGLKGRAG